MINPDNSIKRRKFIKAAAKTGGILLAAPVMNKAESFYHPAATYTVGQVIDLFIKQVPGGTIPNTVDTLKSGDRGIVVTGIVTAMFATIGVIRKAIALNANFIIAHEPTFYNHEDKTEWLKGNEVYEYKAALLKQHNIAVWRNHDYIHTLVPDGVTKGVLEQLEWQHYADSKMPNIIILPPIPLRQLIAYTKRKLGIEMVRYIGDPEQAITRVLFMPGAAGGTAQIEDTARLKPDVLLCGEIHEWETAEYFRDARAKGEQISLVVLGHIASEDAGSLFMQKWLKQNVPSITSTYVKPGNSLSFI